MKIFELTDIRDILAEHNLFIPAEVVITHLIDLGKATESNSFSRFISTKKYSTTEEAIIKVANEILSSGYSLCVSGNAPKEANLPKIDEVFESLLDLAKDEIVLVAPYVSSEFMSDLQTRIAVKKKLVTIITNSPNSKLANKNQYASINKLRKMGFTVKLAKEDIHAKIYFFDEKVALVGSSNLTRNGFFDFYEIGTVIFGKDCQKIKIILCQMV